MTAAAMNSSSVSVASLSNTRTAANAGLSLRDWLGVVSSALAMAGAVPSAGRVTAKQMAHVRAMASAI